MSDDNKPPRREWWIVRHFIGKGSRPCLVVCENKPDWRDIQLGDERVHVVPASDLEACEALLKQVQESHKRQCTINDRAWAKNKDLIEALKFYANGSWDGIKALKFVMDKGDIARAALKENQ